MYGGAYDSSTVSAEVQSGYTERSEILNFSTSDYGLQFGVHYFLGNGSLYFERRIGLSDALLENKTNGVDGESKVAPTKFGYSYTFRSK